MKSTLFLITFIAAIFCVFSASTDIHAQSSVRTFSESHVIRSLRQLHSAQSTYQATTGAGNYGSLQSLRQAGFIDDALATGRKYGFVYVVSTTTGPARFTVTAIPERYRKTGIRSFFMDTSGEMRAADRQGEPGSPTDPVIDDCTSGSILQNEQCTILDMRAVASAQAIYATTTGDGNYAPLAQLYLVGLIRPGLSDSVSRGYSYTVQTIDHEPGVNPASFKVWATPVTWGVTGVRSFYIDQTGILRGANHGGSPASDQDPPIK